MIDAGLAIVGLGRNAGLRLGIKVRAAAAVEERYAAVRARLANVRGHGTAITQETPESYFTQGKEPS